MKKKILFQSDFALAKSGFGRNAKAVLSYLYKTGKYEIVQYCCGMNYSHQSFRNTPWKSVGTLPDNQQEIQRLESDPAGYRRASYGAKYLDKVVKQEKPDVYIAVQDIWGIDYAVESDWFAQANSVLWTTLDSLPLLSSAVEIAPKVKNYWIWSSFATEEMHRLGHKHVRTMHGAIEDENFFKISATDKDQLRNRHAVPQDAFIIGYVFRNQLRKSVPNLLEGFKIFQQENPSSNAKLLLHTNFDEREGGWDINKLAGEYAVSMSDVLATYVCHTCKNYEVKPYQGKGLPCQFCDSKDSQNTCGIQAGINERQLNEVYNLMDVYCHPFTSGGQEFPIQEAKLTELITLVTNYSCGEEMCQEGAYSFPLDWSEYREHHTQFRKASTLPTSIAEKLSEVYKMPHGERERIGGLARAWALENYSLKAVGKKIEEFIDSCPEVDKSIYEDGLNKNPVAVVNGDQQDDDWIRSLYKEILDRKNIPVKDSGFQYWKEELKKGASRGDVEDYFRRVAKEDLLKEDFNNLLNKNDKGKRVLYAMPEGIADVFSSTSLFKSIKDLYPECNLYVATRPEFFEILDGNPYIYKVIPYVSDMDNLLWLEGNGDHEGYFEVAYIPYVNTQRIFTYQHNGKDKLEYDLDYV